MTLPEYDEKMDDDQISEIENNLLQGILGTRTTEAVEAAITYAKFLSSVGITPDNYPLFLKMLEIENHWVIDALVADRDPFLMLSPVQPNKFIVNKIFAMLTKWRRGGIYSTNLSVILGVIQTVYSSPNNGYRIYPLNIADLNALGKHLNKEHGQDDPLNRVILDILENLSDLEGKEDSEMEEIAIHSSSVRNAFFDDRKEMEDVIPPVLLVTLDDRTEVPPRTLKRVVTEAKPKKAAPKKAKSKATEEEEE